MNHFTALVELVSLGALAIGHVLERVRIWSGDSAVLKTYVRDLEGRAVVLSGYTVTMEFALADGSVATVNGTLTAAASGIVEFELLKTLTAQMSGVAVDVVLTLTQTSTQKLVRIRLPKVLQAGPVQ